jgi:hypothetical protein
MSAHQLGSSGRGSDSGGDFNATAAAAAPDAAAARAAAPAGPPSAAHTHDGQPPAPVADDEDDPLDRLLDAYTAQAEEETARALRKHQQRARRGHQAPAAARRSAALAAPLPADNKGAQLLSKMGFAPGQGLGRNKQGRAEPLPLLLKAGRAGLGVEEGKRQREQEAERRALKEGAWVARALQLPVYIDDVYMVYKHRCPFPRPSARLNPNPNPNQTPNPQRPSASASPPARRSGSRAPRPTRTRCGGCGAGWRPPRRRGARWTSAPA